MFHLVDFQVTIAEILLIIMRTFKVSIWNLDYIINLIIKNLSKSLTENKYSQLDEEQPMALHLIERFITDNTQLDGRFALLSQAYVMNDKQTVEQAIAEVDASIKITSYVRFELGEGIEKKEEDFAAEVAKQMGK